MAVHIYVDYFDVWSGFGKPEQMYQLWWLMWGTQDNGCVHVMWIILMCDLALTVQQCDIV